MTGYQERVEAIGSEVGRFSPEICMDQGGLFPVTLSPAGTFPEGPKMHHATQRKKEQPHCAVWSTRKLNTYKH